MSRMARVDIALPGKKEERETCRAKDIPTRKRNTCVNVLRHVYHRELLKVRVAVI